MKNESCRTWLLVFVAVMMIFAQYAYSADKSQTTCPVMGRAINKSLYVDHAGKRIYVCCGGCVSAVKSDPAKYIEQLETQGIELEKTPVAE